MNLEKMTFEELAQLKNQIDNAMKEHTPFAIKEVWRKCGKSTCRCSEPFDPIEYDSEEHHKELCWHGPYLYANWRENGKTKTTSLGRKYTKEEITAMQYEKAPVWYDDAFTLTQKRYDNMAQDLRWECYERSLLETEYLAKYGVSWDTEAGDRFQRKTSFIFNAPKFQAAQDTYKKTQEIAYSKWARYGIGSLKALTKLQDLEAKKFYFKP